MLWAATPLHYCHSLWSRFLHLLRHPLQSRCCHRQHGQWPHRLLWKETRHTGECPSDSKLGSRVTPMSLTIASGFTEHLLSSMVKSTTLVVGRRSVGRLSNTSVFCSSKLVTQLTQCSSLHSCAAESGPNDAHNCLSLVYKGLEILVHLNSYMLIYVSAIHT